MGLFNLPSNLLSYKKKKKKKKKKFPKKLSFTLLHYDLEETTEKMVVACHCIASSHVNHHQL